MELIHRYVVEITYRNARGGLKYTDVPYIRKDYFDEYPDMGTVQACLEETYSGWAKDKELSDFDITARVYEEYRVLQVVLKKA